MLIQRLVIVKGQTKITKSIQCILGETALDCGFVINMFVCQGRLRNQFYKHVNDQQTNPSNSIHLLVSLVMSFDLFI